MKIKIYILGDDERMTYIEEIKSKEQLEFVIFCIENVAEKLNVSGKIIYDVLNNKSDILKGYIIPSYEPLHTQGKDYIVDEILDVMKERGVAI